MTELLGFPLPHLYRLPEHKPILALPAAFFGSSAVCQEGDGSVTLWPVPELLRHSPSARRTVSGCVGHCGKRRTGLYAPQPFQQTFLFHLVQLASFFPAAEAGGTPKPRHCSLLAHLSCVVASCPAASALRTAWLEMQTRRNARTASTSRAGNGAIWAKCKCSITLSNTTANELGLSLQATRTKR